MEEKAMVKALVWDSKDGVDSGFCAEFEGEEISSYVDGDIVYMLFKCTKYHGFDAYRVHVYDETLPSRPKYELLPYKGNPQDPKSYKEPYDEVEIANKFPRFLLDLKDFPVHNIDAEPLRGRG